MIQQYLDNLNIKELNKMQLAAVELATEDKDMLLLSPTGSGKTLAFLLPVIKRIKKDKEGVQALILVPSRELALQIEQVFKQMQTGFKVNCCYGGHSTQTERNNLSHPPAVLIGTPGRIAYHVREENFNTEDVRVLVLDEFDKSLELGFQEEMSFIISHLRKLQRRLLTSATTMDEIPSFAGVKNFEKIDFLDENKPTEALQLKYIRALGNDKLDILFNLICFIGTKATLIFCNHRDAVERISLLLKERGIVHDIFHGGMEQEDRERALIKFRNGSHHLLITTDLASRGLDIPEIESIVHYQLPLTADAFTHRNGRTARMFAKGKAYLVLSETEELPDFITQEVEEQRLPDKLTVPENSKWITLYFGAGKKDKVNKIDIVGFLIQKGGINKEEIGKIEVLDYASYVAVPKNNIEEIIRKLKEEKIKNKKVKIAVSY